MLHAKMDIFFRLPNDDNRPILHPATLSSVADGVYTAELSSAALSMEPQQEMLLYFQERSKFLQQPIRIEAVLESQPRMIVGFKTTGEPVSAESRNCFRVSTVIGGLMATVGSDTSCPVNDISSTGFSITSAHEYQVGTNVPISIVHEGRKYSGTACVQSIRELDNGQIRYGLFCLTGRSASGDLAKGLSQISMAFQRAQLRRLAGA